MAKDQAVTDRVSRRQFASVAAAAAAGWLLTACGPRRLHEIPRDRLRDAIKRVGARLLGEIRQSGERL